MSKGQFDVPSLSESLLDHQLSRRTLLKRTAALSISGAAFASLLVACGDDDGDDAAGEDDQETDASTDSEDDEATEEDAAEDETADEADATEEAGDSDSGDEQAAGSGGTLNVPLNGDPTMNPFTWPNQLPAILVGKNIWSTLVKYSAEDARTPVADLATDWEVSDDGLQYTFNLRDDVTWHDGEPFTSEDVQFTISNILNEDVLARFRTALRGVTEVEVPDETTAIIHTSEPLGSLIILLGYNIPMAPQHILDGEDLNEIPEYVQQPIGTGPFQVREYAEGTSMTLDAYDDYFDGRPNIDTVVYHVIADVNAVVAQLLTGELDLAAIEPVNLEALEGAENINVVSVLEPNTFFLAINNTREPFGEVPVRKALTLAVDRQQIVDEILLGYADLATSAYSPAFGDFFNDSIEPYPYDPDQAASSMEEAGWTMEDGVWARDGEPLSFTLMVDQGNPTREQIALAAQQFWGDFGAQVELQVEEWSVYIERGNSLPGDYDTRTGWRITAPDPDKTAEYHTDGDVNHYGYSNSEVDELLIQGRQEVDHEARVEIYHEIQQLLYDDAAICWLYYPQGLMAVNNRVQNVPEIGIRDVLLYTYQFSLDG